MNIRDESYLDNLFSTAYISSQPKYEQPMKHAAFPAREAQAWRSGVSPKKARPSSGNKSKRKSKKKKVLIDVNLPAIARPTSRGATSQHGNRQIRFAPTDSNGKGIDGYQKGGNDDSTKSSSTAPRIVRKTKSKHKSVKSKEKLKDFSSCSVEFLKWSKLRYNYLAKLKDVVKSMTEAMQGGSAAQSENRVLSLTLLLAGIRKISVKILTLYETSLQSYATSHAADFQSLLLKMEDYVVNLVSSLEWVPENILRDNIGISAYRNPLLHYYNIDKEPSIFSKSFDQMYPTFNISTELIPQVLQMSHEELQNCEYCNDLIRRAVDRRESGQADFDVSNISNEEEDMYDRDVSRNLLSLNYDDDAIDARDAHQMQQIEHQQNFTRLYRYLSHWKTSLQYEYAVKDSLYYINQRIMQKVFDVFVVNHWRSQQFQKMQRNYLHR
jgi:hypothetical protein